MHNKRPVQGAVFNVYELLLHGHTYIIFAVALHSAPFYKPSPHSISDLFKVFRN